MKICVVAYKFGTEKEIGEHLGTYHYFIEKMRRLVKMGHEVYLIAPWLSFKKMGSTNVDGVKIIRYYPLSVNNPKLFPFNRIINYWYKKATQRQVLRLDAQVDLAVVYVWQARLTGYAVAEVSDRLKAPFVFRQITAWNWHFERSLGEIFGKKPWYKLVKALHLDALLEFLLGRKAERKHAAAIYKKAKKVVFLSKVAMNEAVSLGFPEEKGRIIGVAIETDIFKPRGDKSTKNILFVGRINFAEKGIGVLVEAMKEIAAQIPEAKLVIVGGGGETERLKKMIFDLGLENHVELTGKVPFSALAPYLDAARVMVVPSIWMEAFGQVTIIGMAAGLPMVTSDAGASPEINIDGETGLVVPAGDKNKLASAIVRILGDRELAQRFGEAARKRVEQNYTYEALVNKFIEVVKKANS